jgi:phosphate transport system substrate-binding protein
VRIEAGTVENESRVSGIDAQGHALFAEVAAHGSATGFVGLDAGSADVAAASRPIKPEEATQLSRFGDMHSRLAEQVIGIDGLAILVHPDNPLDSLSTEQLARIFSGEAKNWEDVGGRGGAIHLYARDDKSGTYDTFKELVLTANGKSLGSAAKRFESSDELAAAVGSDPHGIGFVGLSSVGGAKALSIRTGDAAPMLPRPELVATEDYPLSRRLYLYVKPDEANPWVAALVEFAHSPKGQAIVERTGFVGQDVQAMRVAPSPSMPENYARLAREAVRLSVNFRFQNGRATLDNKARRDVERLLAYLKAQGKTDGQVVLVGFGDPKSTPERTELLSRLRAMAVRRPLAHQGVMLRDIIGVGAALPVASNAQDDGRIKNRRVEVWVY